jgi:hypothetical protein
VTAPSPQIASLSTYSVTQGDTGTLTISGSNFIESSGDQLTLNFSGASNPFTLTSTPSVCTTTCTATFSYNFSGYEGGFLRSAQPYSTAVTGIYSTKPGVIGRRQKTDPSNMKDEVPMAMTGIVPTKVSAENGPFHSGPVTSNLSSREHKPTISSGKVRRRAYKQWNHYSA